MKKQKIFKKQQELRSKLKNMPIVTDGVSIENKEEYIKCEVNYERILSFDYLKDISCPIEVSNKEAKKLLNELKNCFYDNKLEKLFNDIQNDLIKSIAGPFGFGKIVSAYDKIGGNVNTIHNVRNKIIKDPVTSEYVGVYATAEDCNEYQKRGEYDTDSVHKNDNYKKVNKKFSSSRKIVGIEDGYSGITLNDHDKTDLDHVVSGKQTHDDPGRVLAGKTTEELANISDNLIPTHRSINRSKKAKSPEEFASWLENTSISRKAEIEKLSSKKELTEKERKTIAKLKQLDSVDPDDVRAQGRLSKEAQDKILNKAYYFDIKGKFAKNTFNTSVTEGAKMGAQQAFGLLLIELFSASFGEIRNAFSNGLEGENLFNDVKIRLRRISINIGSKWKEAIIGFGSGFISGFISNIITTIINVFFTTGKRFVRMIREGFYSLLNAIKTILFPPQGLNFQQAAHEAMKLIASGGIVLAGVALEEVVEKLISTVPVLALIAPTITAVIVGSISAVGMALVCYLIDKIDLLSVVKLERDQFIIENLVVDIRKKLDSCERIAEQLDGYLEMPTVSC